ncbi:beta strand repeat-containing protein [Lampropedia puyangensis]|nr:Ig-like domain-containing protein [Lampropedia puyangensis]
MDSPLKTTVLKTTTQWLLAGLLLLASLASIAQTNQPPLVTGSHISISGGTGTAGAYKINDTVTATWNNTASNGDNNAGITSVTVNFSQFGGGSAVMAINYGNFWTATYQITAGSIDLTSRNVSVTATNAGGSTTTAGTANATVDNIAPTVTDGRISISGATGTSGAYKIGDMVTATWNDTASGDNNSDTISAVTVDFTDFGGGAAVSASNSSGNWTATYTIVAGSIDAVNRNVRVTARDNAGNTTTTPDTTNATVDNIAPYVVSITPAGGFLSSDTTVDFTVDFSEPVSNVSIDDFTLVPTGPANGTITSVSASAGNSITVTVSGITGAGTLKVNLNGSTNIVDDVGNPIAAYSSGSAHTVNILTAPAAPTIGSAVAGNGQVSVAFTAPQSSGGSAITGYTVTSNPGGITGGGNGFTSSPIMVSGLTNGTTYTFTVTATNAIGTSAASAASNSVTPKAPNQAPVISGTPPTRVNQDTAYVFTPRATDADGDTLTFSITNIPSWASFDLATGALTGRPAKAHVGVTSGIVITVSDGEFSVSLPAFNLTVINVNDAPTIAGVPLTSVSQGQPYLFVPTAADVDVGAVLTFTISHLPAWASLDPATGTLSGTPTDADVGTTTSDIVITVSDGELTASLPAFDLSVTAHPVVPPVADWGNMLDQDQDSVPDEVEALVPSLDGVSRGDGNGDGIADATQPYVTSLPWQQSPSGELSYVTLSNDSQLAQNQVTTSPAPSGLPHGLQLPYGLLSFEVTGVPHGGTVNFSVYVDADAKVDGYYKQNRETGQWVNIATGIHPNGARKRIDFSLTDGGPFDMDAAANGSIVDPGGPGMMATHSLEPVPVPVQSPWSVAAMAMLLAGVASRCTRRKAGLRQSRQSKSTA